MISVYSRHSVCKFSNQSYESKWKFDTQKVLILADLKVVPVFLPRLFQKTGNGGKLEFDEDKVKTCKKALCWGSKQTLLHKAAKDGDCEALKACTGLFANGKNKYSHLFGKVIIECLQTRNEQNQTPIDIDQGLKNC